MTLKYWPLSMDYSFCRESQCPLASSCMRQLGYGLILNSAGGFVSVLIPDKAPCDAYWDATEYIKKQNEQPLEGGGV